MTGQLTVALLFILVLGSFDHTSSDSDNTKPTKLEDAVRGVQTTFPPAGHLRRSSLEEADALRRAASKHLEGRNYGRAEPLLTKAVQLYKEHRGEESQAYAACLDLLGCVYLWTGRHQQAETCLVQAAETLLKTAGAGSEPYLDTANNLAGLYMTKSEFEKAKPLLTQVLEGRKRMLGADHPDYAGSLNNLGLLHQRTGHPDLAEPLYREALAIYRKRSGENTEAYADNLQKLGEVFENKRDYVVAELFLTRALTIYSKLLPKNHPTLLKSLDNYAVLLKKMQHDEQADRVSATVKALRSELPKNR
jgi:tetratricopeptide (TPR) repeat protein